MASILSKIRIEREDKKPLIIYRRIYNVQAVGAPNRSRSRTHKAFCRYNKEEIVVYLDSGQWVSYGEAVDSSKGKFR